MSHNLTNNPTTSLDPKNYRVPHTAITVSLEGRPPFGSPLPKDPIILALASAQGKSAFHPPMLPTFRTLTQPLTSTVAASDTIAKFGDIPVSSLWRFEENGIRIDVNTQLSIDCKFSTLETGLLGLVDLINEPGGVGAVAADFILEEDGLGEVASGRLRLEGTYGRVASAVGSAKPVATLVEGGKTASVTLVGGAVETRVVGSA